MYGTFLIIPSPDHKRLSPVIYRRVHGKQAHTIVLVQYEQEIQNSKHWQMMYHSGEEAWENKCSFVLIWHKHPKLQIMWPNRKICQSYNTNSPCNHSCLLAICVLVTGLEIALSVKLSSRTKTEHLSSVMAYAGATLRKRRLLWHQRALLGDGAEESARGILP